MKIRQDLPDPANPVEFSKWRTIDHVHNTTTAANNLVFNHHHFD